MLQLREPRSHFRVHGILIILIIGSITAFAKAIAGLLKQIRQAIGLESARNFLNCGLAQYYKAEGIMVIILCTLDGKSWNYVDQGKRFQANSNRHQKVHIDFFQPIFARAIRIYPQSWNEHMSLRFDAIYVNLD